MISHGSLTTHHWLWPIDVLLASSVAMISSVVALYTLLDVLENCQEAVNVLVPRQRVILSGKRDVPSETSHLPLRGADAF